MKNVKYSVKEKKLTITIDLSQEHGMSKSGKSTTIATTAGNISLGDGAFLGLNVYKI